MKQNTVTVFLATAPDGRCLVNMAQGDKVDERISELARLHKTPLDWQYQIPLRPTEAQGVIDAFHKHFEPQRTEEWFVVGAIEAIQALDEMASRAINYRPEESRIHPADSLVQKILGPGTLTGGCLTDMRARLCGREKLIWPRRPGVRH